MTILHKKIFALSNFMSFIVKNFLSLVHYNKQDGVVNGVNGDLQKSYVVKAGKEMVSCRVVTSHKIQSTL